MQPIDSIAHVVRRLHLADVGNHHKSFKLRDVMNDLLGKCFLFSD